MAFQKRSSLNELSQHRHYLMQALALAQIRRGFCAPNPAVGALLVNGDHIISGHHWQSGDPHAEIVAIKQAPPSVATGATLYVTLEPCCHWGKTPPCTAAIKASGIVQVYYGLRDPNPRVSGQGAAILRAAGIGCEQVPLKKIKQFYASYQFWQQHQRPWVTAKLALSLDGKIAGAHSQPLAITGAKLANFTHLQRKQSDAILTTAYTVRQDDPLLTARLEGQIYPKPLYILDSQLQTPLAARIFTTGAALTFFHQPTASAANKAALEQRGARCIALTATPQGVDLTAVLAQIGQDGKHDLWLEAGGRCFQAFLLEKLINRAFIYVAPKWLGTQAHTAFSVESDLFASAKHYAWRSMGTDAVCEIEFC